MATERLPKDIYIKQGNGLMFTSKWAMELDIWYIENNKKSE